MTTSRIFRSASALMFSTVASSALGMVFWVVAARLFRTEDVGRASAGVSAIMLLGGLGQLGLSSVLIRFVPIIGGAVTRFLRRAYLVSTGMSLVLATGFLMLGLGKQFTGHGALWAVAFCVAVPCACVSSVQDAVLTALRRTSWVPVENVAIAVGRLALLPVLAVTASVDAVLISWGVPMAGAVAVISVGIFSRLLPRHVRMHAGRVRMPSRRDLLRFTSAGYANGLVSNLTTYLPPVFITAILGPAANAVFFVPWLVGTVIYGLLWNIASSFVVEATSDAAQTGTHLRHAARLVLLVGIGSTLTLVAGAPWLLELLGRDYSKGGTTALRLVGLSVPFSCVILLYSVSLLMQRRNWAIFRLSCLSAALSLPLSVIGTYRVGVSGVVGGFLASDAIVALCLLPTVVRRYRALADRSIDDDETAVLDVAGLRAELGQHDRGSFKPNFAEWPGEDHQTVVLDGEAITPAVAEQDATVVLMRVDEVAMVPPEPVLAYRWAADGVEVVSAPAHLDLNPEPAVVRGTGPSATAGAENLGPAHSRGPSAHSVADDEATFS